MSDRFALRPSQPNERCGHEELIRGLRPHQLAQGSGLGAGPSFGHFGLANRFGVVVSTAMIS
jgi:hypothetical protein